MELFTYENHNVVINKPDIYLIKEFNALLESSRNKETGDAKGLLKNRAFRELAYIYLVYDWKSPYSEYSEDEKKEAALADAKLTEKQLSDPVFISAVNKYLSLQDSRILKLLNSAYKAADELRLYFDTVDLQEKDPLTGKPIYAAKNLIGEIASLGKVVEGLEQLRYMVMKERETSSNLKGGSELGMFD